MGPPVVFVRVILGGTVVGVAVGVRVWVLVGTGDPPAAQVGTGVANQVETAAPQGSVSHVQSESKLGQELLVMDQAVPPTTPDVPMIQVKMLVS